MVMFHDALSGKKRELNFKTKPTPSPYVKPHYCEDAVWASWHDFPNMEDDFSRCERCGCTLVYARALENARRNK